MAQQEIMIDLEPIGGREVSSKELTETAKSIFAELQKYRNDDSTQVVTTDAGSNKPIIDTSKWGTYAMYGGATVAGIYLIGKALE